MKYINTFKKHASYEEKLNGGVDITLPNVSYCKDVKDVHYNPYNTVEFYVGEITSPETVRIYTDSSTYVDVTVSERNKWYTYLLPKDKGLFRIEGDSVKKVVVKADISFKGTYYPPITIIPSSTVEASFKGSNTSNVTNMINMFFSCSGLTSLDVSNFNASKVTDMSQMFYSCNSLKSLDLSKFNTSNVPSMSNMFAYCSSLTSLDLRNFNTSNVTDMGRMFYGCGSLTSLDLSGWNTSNVTDMSYMFNSCSGLTSLDLSGWNTSNVTDMGNMFKGCSAPSKEIRMVGCNKETVDKIKAQLTKDGISLNNVNFVTE